MGGLTVIRFKSICLSCRQKLHEPSGARAI
ncbi:MAG: hypothetical protein K1V75_02785 [Muribaculaceae bacterium]